MLSCCTCHFSIVYRWFKYLSPMILEITSNPPNRPIWFVIYPLWFVNAAFCTSQHPTTVKNARQIITFLPKLLHNSNKSRTFAPSVLAKPLNNAQIVRGVFVYGTSHSIHTTKHIFAAKIQLLYEISK